MTNIELAKSLRALAEVYEANADLQRPHMGITVYSKAEIMKLVHAIGGRWKKIMPEEHDTLQDIRFIPDRVPSLTVYIPRDKVCRKTVTWDCEPLLSPEELEEVTA